MPAKKTTRFRELLAQEGIIVLPGAFDAFSARLIQQKGFPAVYMSGSGTAAALLGLPDVGLITMTEMVFNARAIARAVEIPVICDADTGYGNALNVVRCVQEFEQAGVAGIQIEDQVFPKKCGHMEGKQVITKEEMVRKIKAALEARKDPNFVIIARTDARSVLGLGEAISRCQAYLEAGADIIFPEALQSREELALVAREVPGPLVANMTEGGKTPLLTAAELAAMGYKIALFPSATLRVAHKAMADFLKDLKETGTQIGWLDRMQSRQDLYDLVGLPKVNELEARYGI
ncbi:MAG: methylisocitrate lyase [Clostridia bacterium]|nr:methylisocitrate lyase [Clostridia bacterium]